MEWYRVDDTCCLSPAVEYVLVDEYSAIKQNDVVLINFYGTYTCRRYYDAGRDLILKATKDGETIVSQKNQNMIIGVVTEICKKALSFGKNLGNFPDEVVQYKHQRSSV